MTLEPGVRLGPYVIHSALGAGGMGEVYKARDTRLDRTVAIKVLPPQAADNPDARQCVEREARAISALQHPNICTLYDIGHQDRTDYLVMEYLEGETLAERLSRGALPLPEALRYAVEILDALEHAHGQGILHCDLKPSNILLTRSGTKLLDFGIAQIHGQRPPTPSELDRSQAKTETASLASEDALLGTVQYMAPERLEGQPASASADLFAVGAVFYEMITGRKAFDGRDRGEILTAVLTAEPAAASQVQPSVPSALDRVIAQCLAKNPGERWHSAHDLRLELQWIEENGSRTSSPSSSSVRPTVKRAVPWILGTAFIVLITVLVTRSLRPTSVDTHPIRFVVYAPDDAAFFPGGGLMNVSPDGHWLVFVAVRASGQRLLWLRSLESTAARPLAGTDGAANPFWSPDSRFLGFFAKGQLKKIDVFGGTSQTLCEAPSAFGGTWNRDGLILFAPNLRSGLVRVSAAGGPTTAVTHLEAARQDLAHTWPYFLPDGHHFLYRIKTPMDKYTGIYLGSVDAETPHVRLVDADSNPGYTSGYLLFAREGTLLAQVLDVGHARLTGEAVPVAENVMHNLVSGRVPFGTSETGVLAYKTVGPKELLWVDRNGRSLGQLGPVGVYTDPAISPNGDRVAVARLDPRTGTEDIWVIESVRGTASRLTVDPARDSTPIWSSDGRYIVFGSNRGGHSALYQTMADGTRAEELLLSAGESTARISRTATDWSRDGRFVVFTGNSPTTKWDLWVLPMTGERKPLPFLQTAFNEEQGHLSPDGQWMAYISDESGTSEVYVRPFPPSDGKWPISKGGGIEPKWRGNGAELFYLAPDGSLMSVAVRTTRGFTADLPHPLFKTALSGTSTGPTGRNQYDVTADGQRFLLVQPVSSPAASPITVILNWTAALRR